MNRMMIYTDPTTGVAAAMSMPDPAVELQNTGAAHGLTADEEAYYVTKQAQTPFSRMIYGEEKNRIEGGAYVPHGCLEGKEAVLADTANSSATSIVVRQSVTPDGRNIFEAGGKYLIMRRRPKENERATAFTNSSIAAAVITVDAGYVSGNTVTVSALPATYQRGAIVQKLMPLGASYDLERGEYGLRYQKEQPNAVTTVTAVDGGTQTIDVSFIPNTTQAAVAAYMVQILKKGDALSVNSVIEIPEWVQPAEYSDGTQHEAIVPVGSALLVAGTGGIVTLSNLNRYFKPSDGSVSAIVAGTYFVAVRALTSTTLDAACRMSDAAVSAAVIVA